MSKNNKFDMGKFIFGVFVMMILATVVLRIFQFFKTHEKTAVIINSQEILVEVAKTPNELAKGLSGRKNLAKNKGMLFVFDHPDKLTFWMRGMQFPLDFIWIRGDEIRDLSPNVPADYPGLLTGKEEVDKVLEVNAGFIQRHNITVGNKMTISE